MTSRQMNQMQKLLAANPGLSRRDMRDLLMEYGCDGITASQLTEGRD